MPSKCSKPRTKAAAKTNRVPSASYNTFVKTMAAAVLAPQTRFDKHPTKPKTAVARTAAQ